MRIFAFIPVLAALVTAVAGASACKNTEMGCSNGNNNNNGNGNNGNKPDPDPHGPKRDFAELPSRDGHGLSNAELLRRGLPLKGPVMRRGTPVRRTNPSAVPVPMTHTGVVQVLDSSNNVLGYIAKDLGNAGAQYVYNPSITNALAVTFQTDQTGSGTQLDINAVNSNPSWPFLGLVQGREDTDSNLSPGSYEYLYLAGVANPGTQPGDSPQSISNSYFIGAPRTAETAVWTFDITTGVLTPQWINTDGSSPAEQFFTQSTGLYVGGSQDAFHSRFPAPVTAISFKFIPQ